MSLQVDLEVTRVPSYLLSNHSRNDQQKTSKSLSNKVTGIGNSKDATGVKIKMLPPLIKNNRTQKIFPFSGLAKLYCVTIVVSDMPNQAVGGIDLNGFPRIGDNEHLPLNKTIFYWQQKESGTAPDQIHFLS